MSTGEEPTRPPKDYDLDDVLAGFDDLEETVTSTEERDEVQRVRRMLERVPGREHIYKYTTRDIAEGFVGGIVFALPLLVEDGVFEIAEWFVAHTIGPIPLFLLLNAIAVITLVAGLLYFTDIRSVKVRLLFGFLPKRLAGILIISFLVATLSMLMWGRLHAGDPTQLENLARITIIWAAAALGSTLGDILPGESQGEDLATLISDLGDGGEWYGGTE